MRNRPDIRRAFVFLVGAAASAPSVHSADLLLNGSIEQYQGLGRPYGWTHRRSDAARVSRSAADARSGSHALDFDLSFGDGPEWNSRRQRIEPGARYQATFWFRTDEVFSEGELSPYVRWWADDSWDDWQGQSRLATGVGRRVTDGWVEVSAIVVAPAGARYGEMHLWSVDSARGPSGRVLLDDFSLRPLPLSSEEANPLPPDGAQGMSVIPVLRRDSVPAATAYHLYLGEDYAAVRDASERDDEFVITIPGSSRRPSYAATLAPYTRYFWRMDVETDGGTQPGPVWSFVTGFDLLEDSTRATRRIFGAKDNQGRGLDTLDVIEDPQGAGYLGVYHTRIGGEFELRLARSTDLLSWTFVRTLEPNADMPALWYLDSRRGFLLVHEQWGNPGSRSPSNLRFQYFDDRVDLFAGRESRSFLAPLTRSRAAGSDLEGTPGFLDVSSTGARIDIGFHYFDANGGRVDRNARGTLRGFLTEENRWTTSTWTEVNEALVSHEVVANIGDRADGRLFGRRLLPIEGQYRVGDFGSWRGWCWDYEREEAFPLHLKTPGGSTAAGNLSWEFLISPAGRPAVLTSAFFFSEGASPGEEGQGIWYRELGTSARSPVPRHRDSDVTRPVALYWLGAPGATAHDVYIATDSSEVEAADRDSEAFDERVELPTLRVDSLQPGTKYFWRVDSVIDGTTYPGSVWEFTTGGAGPAQTPGDCNEDGTFDISDPICLLGHLFLGNPTRLPCGDGTPGDSGNAMLLDWQADDAVDISDGIGALAFLFAGGPPHRSIPAGRACLTASGCPATCGE